MGKSAEPSFLAQEPAKPTESPKPASSGGGVIIIIFISFFPSRFIIYYFIFLCFSIYFLSFINFSCYLAMGSHTRSSRQTDWPQSE